MRAANGLESHDAEFVRPSRLKLRRACPRRFSSTPFSFNPLRPNACNAVHKIELWVGKAKAVPAHHRSRTAAGRIRRWGIRPRRSSGRGGRSLLRRLNSRVLRWRRRGSSPPQAPAGLGREDRNNNRRPTITSVGRRSFPSPASHAAESRRFNRTMHAYLVRPTH